MQKENQMTKITKRIFLLIASHCLILFFYFGKLSAASYEHIGYFTDPTALAKLKSETTTLGGKTVSRYCDCKFGITKTIKKEGKKVSVKQIVCLENTIRGCQPTKPTPDLRDKEKEEKDVDGSPDEPEDEYTGGPKELLLLNRSPGCYFYGPSRYRYGIGHFLNAIKSFCADINEKKSSLDIPTVGLGHISSRFWGRRFSKHKSHRFGQNADWRPVKKGSTSLMDQAISKNRINGLQTNIYSKQYSHIRTKRMVSLMKQTIDPVVILFNDLQVPGVKYWKKHHNHIHITYRK